MKRIGVLFGQERTFPLALVDRINGSGVLGVAAEPVRLGGVSLETPRGYDLVLDRISQDIPFYRAVLKKLAAQGTVVVNNPFWWSADDKFFNNVVARAAGVAVPKTVLLPSHTHPPDTTSASMSNLTYPLDWEALFSHVVRWESGIAQFPPGRLGGDVHGEPGPAARHRSAAALRGPVRDRRRQRHLVQDRARDRPGRQ